MEKLMKSELWVTIVGIVGMVAAAINDSGLIPDGSIGYTILGMVIAIASYVGGRSWVKVAEVKAKASVLGNASLEARSPLGD